MRGHIIPRKAAALAVRVEQGFGLQISGFKSRVSGFGLRVLGHGFQVSSFGSRVSGFSCRGLGFGFRAQAIRVSGFRCREKLTWDRFGGLCRPPPPLGFGFRVSGVWKDSRWVDLVDVVRVSGVGQDARRVDLVFGSRVSGVGGPGFGFQV